MNRKRSTDRNQPGWVERLSGHLELAWRIIDQTVPRWVLLSLIVVFVLILTVSLRCS